MTNTLGFYLVETAEGLLWRNRVYLQYITPQHKEDQLLEGRGSEHENECIQGRWKEGSVRAQEFRTRSGRLSRPQQRIGF